MPLGTASANSNTVRDGTVEIWDAERGALLSTFEQNPMPPRSNSVSSNDRSIIAKIVDERVELWDSTMDRFLHRLDGHAGQVSAVKFSPDDRILASSGSDNTIELWDPHSGRLLHTLVGEHTEFAHPDILFSPDGRTLASGVSNGTINLWEVETGRHRYTLKRQPSVSFSIAFSSDGKSLAFANANTIELRDTASGRLLRVFGTQRSSGVDRLAVSSGEQFLATSSRDHRVELWDFVTGRRLRALDVPRPVESNAGGNQSLTYSVAFSPDARMLATSDADNAVKLWDPHAGRLLHTLVGHTRFVDAVTFASEGSILASGGRDDTIKLWSVPRAMAESW